METVHFIEGAKGVLCDIDGCLISDQEALPGAIEFLEWCGDRVALISNNSTHLPEEIARQLGSVGVEMPPDRIVLAGESAVRLVADSCCDKSVQVIASPAIRDLARGLGVRLVSQESDVVLLCRNEQATVSEFQFAIDSLAAGAEAVVANSDISHPGPDGTPRIETGAVWSLISACIPGITARFVGKPQPCLFDIAMTRLGSKPENTVVIGDNPFTDGAGARRCGAIPVMVSPPGTARGVRLGEVLRCLKAVGEDGL